jgi:hypothetical protein
MPEYYNILQSFVMCILNKGSNEDISNTARQNIISLMIVLLNNYFKQEEPWW